MPLTLIGAAALTGIIGLCVISVQSTRAALVMIIGASFSLGLCQAVGIPLAAPKAVSEMLAIVLFTKAVYLSWASKSGRMILFGATAFVGTLICGTLAALLEGGSTSALALFARDILKFYLLFVAVLNLGLCKRTVAIVCTLALSLFLLQLPVSWLKLATVGIDEAWIGTVHMNAGELSIMLPLFAIVFLMSAYLYLRRPVYLWLIVLFALFAVIGEKRSTIVFVPAVLCYAFAYYRIAERPRKGRMKRSFVATPLWTNVAMLVAICGTVFYVGLRAVPSLNPEEQVWGTFDPNHAWSYMVSYTLRDLEDPLNNPDVYDTSVKMGRTRMTIAAFQTVLGGNAGNVLFGYGGGATNSSYLGTGGEDVTFERFGIRGPSTGMIRTVLESGFLGLALMLAFFSRLYFVLQRIFFGLSDPQDKAFALGVLGTHAVFSLDFLAYSNSTMLYGVLTPTYFFLIAITLAGYKVRVGSWDGWLVAVNRRAVVQRAS